MRPASVASILCLAPGALAFYPYVPPWEKDRSHDSKPSRSRRHQQQPSNNQPATGFITLPLTHVPVKRSNGYDFDKAQNPTFPNSARIDSDGIDYSYMTVVQFGKDKTEYHMLVDTAASNTWVMSSDCKTSTCNAHNTFGKEDSSTLKSGTKSFDIHYGTGNVNGTTATDSVTIGGKTVDLTFGLATGVSSDFDSFPMDGILGFGQRQPDPDQVNATSLLDALVSSGQIKSRVLGINLGRKNKPPNDGQLNFGAPNPAMYSGDLNWMDSTTNSRFFWEVPIDDASADGKSLNLKGFKAILDTGTTMILAPPKAAASLHAGVQGNVKDGENYLVPCDTKTSIELTLGGKSYKISPDGYVNSNARDNLCYSNIIPKQTFNDDEMLVGDIFLKDHYLVLDYEKKRIGLGVKDGTRNSASSAGASAATAASASGMNINTNPSASPLSTTATGTASKTAESTLPRSTFTGVSVSGNGSSRPTNSGSPTGGLPVENTSNPSAAPNSASASAARNSASPAASQAAASANSIPQVFSFASGLLVFASMVIGGMMVLV